VGGRPPFQPTPEQRRQVELLVAHGNAEWIIARIVGCDRKTLRRHFRDELRDGREMLIARMGLCIVRAGLAGDWRAAAYWLARFGGPQWRLTSRVGISGALVVTTDKLDVRSMTDDELRREIAELERKQVAGLPKRSNGMAH
jgi:hypothetical protein